MSKFAQVGLFLLAFVFTILASATSITALDHSQEACGAVEGKLAGSRCPTKLLMTMVIVYRNVFKGFVNKEAKGECLASGGGSFADWEGNAMCLSTNCNTNWHKTWQLAQDFKGIPRTFIALTEMLGLIWIDLGSIGSSLSRDILGKMP